VTRRITVALLGLTLLLLASVVVPLGWTTAEHDRQLFADRSTAAANAAAAAAEEHLTEHSARPLTGSLDLPPPVTEGDTVTVYDAAGRPISPVDPSGPATRSQVDAALAGRTTVDWLRHPEDTLLVAVPVRAGPRLVGALTLVRETGALDQQLRGLVFDLSLAGAIALGLAAALAVALAHWVGRPLRHLGRTAALLGAGTLDARAGADAGPPELRALATTFNDMAARLSSLFDGHRAFVADVSHQLRTPLATMRLRLELLRDDVDAATGEELAQALAEVQRLSRLLDGLLAVARAENSDSAVRGVDLTAILAERAAAWRPVAAEAGVALRLDAPPGLAAAATPDHLDQALDNLIANALDVVPTGGAIVLSGAAGPDGARITVADSGPGMSEQQKASAFRRFWTEARADVDDRGGRRGTGLGLAIVHRLVTADGGRIHLADSDLGGLAAHIDLLPVQLPAPAGEHSRPRSKESIG